MFAELGDPGCGNGVLEPALDEDCDGHGEADGSVCGGRESEHACRYLCGDDVDATCPAGWACGDDGVCSAAGGAFEDPAVIAVPGALFATADVDGDGHSDVVSFNTTELTVAYGDSDARFLEVRGVPAPPADEVPVVTDLDGDGAADIALPVAEGLQLFRGAANRELSPVALPSSSLSASGPLRVLAVRARGPAFRREPVVVTAAPVLLAFEDGVAIDAVEVVDALGAGTLARNVGTSAADGAADVIAFANDGGDVVVIATITCVPQGACTTTVLQTLPLRGGLVGAAGTFFGDIDGDGDDDLFVALSGADVAVARNTGGVLAELSVVPGLAARGQPAGSVLVIADLDGDGRDDVLADNGVYLNRPDGQGVRLVQAARSLRPWNLGVVVDANGDGVVDVVGTRPGFVDVVLQADAAAFNIIQVPVAGVVSAVTVGDFDGDLRPEVAIVESQRRVVVLFPDERGLPATRVLAAELPGPAANLVAFRHDDDGIDDLFVAVAGSAELDAVQIVLEGTSAQRPVATLPLQGPVFAAVEGGRFTAARGDDAGNDLVVIGVLGTPAGRRLGFRVAPGTLADGTAVPETTTPVADPACGLPTGIGILVRHADLDDDGVDELVLLETFTPERDAVRPPSWQLWVLRPTGDVLGCAVRGGVVGAAPRSLHLADVDGDGRTDAVALLDPASAQSSPADAVVEIAVWWGIAGGFDDQPAQFVVDVERAAALVPAELDGDPARELVLHHTGGLDAVHFEDRQPRRVSIAPSTGLSAVTSSPGSAGVTGAPVVDDIDGDGLDDVLIGGAASVLWFRQLPCTAARADAALCVRATPGSPL